MRWGGGGLWGVGSLWGIDQDPNGALYCQLADDRVLIQMGDATANRQFRDFLCMFVEQLGEDVTVLQDIAAAFDLDTAQGEQLDMIGSLLDLPRQGFDDDRYRTFLQIQVQLILSAMRDEANWTGTHNNILEICRTFIGPFGSISLQNLSPYSFVLSIPSITDPVELGILISFLCKALYAGVLGQIIQTLGPDSLWSSDSVVIPEGAIWCSASVAIPGCATWGTTTPIGLCP
jgi:hypothetical protein